MIVFDVTDSESFKNVSSWLIEVEKYNTKCLIIYRNASKNVYKILIGNKCDLEDKRQVTYEQGQEMAEQYGMKYIETSAKSAYHVEEAFVTMTKEVINQNAEKEKAMKKNGI